jgi:hypothetical protein
MMEARLRQLPEKRELPWRPGVDPVIEKGGEPRRRQIRLAQLLATRGEVQYPPCTRCANGRGKFKVCIALPGYFKGACASCSVSNRCSIRNSGASRHNEAYDACTEELRAESNELIVEQPRSLVAPTVEKDRPFSKLSI